MTFILTYVILYILVFAPAYAIARRCDNTKKEALWIAAIAALYIAAIILVPAGQSEF